MSRGVPKRKHARRKPIDRLRLLAETLANSLDAVLITDARSLDGSEPRIVYANAAFARMTGYALAELVDRSPCLLQGAETSPEARERIHAAIAGSVPIRIEVRTYRKDGSALWVDLALTPVMDERGRPTHWIGMQRDITASHQAEEVRIEAEAAARAASDAQHQTMAVVDERALQAASSARLYALEQERADQLAALQAVTAALSAASTLEEVADVLLIQGCSALRAVAGAMWLRSPDDAWLERIDSAGYSAAALASFARIALDADTPPSEAVLTGRAIFLESNEAWRRRYPSFAARYDSVGLRPSATLPLVIDERAIGALSVSFDRTLSLGPADGQFMHALAQVGAQALERAREQAALAAVSALLASGLDPAATYGGILEQLARAVPCTRIHLGLVQDGWVVLAAHWGEPPLPPGSRLLRLDPTNGPWQSGVLVSGIPYLPDAELEPSFPQLWPAADHRARSVIAAPLDLERLSPSYLTLISTTPDRYSPRQVRLVGIFAERCAQALRAAELRAAEHARARVVEDLAALRQEQSEEAAALAGVRVAMGAVLDPDRLYALILEQVAHVLPCDAAHVMLSLDGWAVAVACWGALGPRAGSQLFRIDSPDRGWLPDQSARASYLADTLLEPRWVEIPPALGPLRLRSVIVAPLLVEGVMLGYLAVCSMTPNAYTARHVELAALFAERATYAVRNARLYAAEQERARAAEELARLRDEFVATVSHELRTPLTAIIGYGELLQARWEGLSDAERRDWIVRIVFSANRQRQLVEDLLLLAQLDHRIPAVQAALVDMPPLLARAAEEVEASYRSQLIERAGPSLLWAWADPPRVLQIVINLADNAAKYSPEGSPVFLTWGLASSADPAYGIPAGDWVLIRVRDHGSGIPLSGRERLFERFGKLSGAAPGAGEWAPASGCT